MHNKANADALEAWRKAMEGYAHEGLHENMLGVAKKVLRHASGEEEVYLQISAAYRELEYFADSIVAFRSYLKLAKKPSESEMRGWFKKTLDCEIRHPHLLEELGALYKESQVDDIELQKALEGYLAKMQTAISAAPKSDADVSAADEEEGFEREFKAPTFAPSADGLNMLDNTTTNGPINDFQPTFGQVPPSFQEQSSPSSDFEDTKFEFANNIPAGEGKDHYDLGIVYTEMKLWDAAIAEFENARRDPSVRHQATLGLAHCYQATNDLQKALDLLENEREGSSAASGDGADIQYQIGVVHELLGNLTEALNCFEEIKGRTTSLGSAESKIQELKSRMSANPH
jgi:tetratricopeptide (TPR) repeat protein